MKTLRNVFISLVAVVAAGCVSDQSSATEPPVKVSPSAQAATTPGAPGANPNVPQSTKDALKNVAPISGGN